MKNGNYYTLTENYVTEYRHTIEAGTRCHYLAGKFMAFNDKGLYVCFDASRVSSNIIELSEDSYSKIRNLMTAMIANGMWASQGTKLSSDSEEEVISRIASLSIKQADEIIRQLDDKQ